MLSEDDYIWLSGIQNFAFCRRQWALMRIEGLWAENLLTAEGTIQHEIAHDPEFTELRADKYTVRALKIVSHKLHRTGECDVVEFHRTNNDDGISLRDKDGKWIPVPIEYKHGKPKEGNEDRLQLCAEALCIEEMLCCRITYGYLFYQSIRRRIKVILDENLRTEVFQSVNEMWNLQNRQYTPVVKSSKKCGNCSIKELCVSKLKSRISVSEYINKHIS